MGLFLKKRVEMPDKMILGNTEFVFDRKLGFHVGEWIVWDRKTKVLLEFQSTEGNCSATSFLRNWDSILEKKRANLRSISEPARLRQPPPRSTGAAHARGRAQSIREERRIAAPPVLFALLWVRLLPALYGPFCGPLRPFGGCPWGVTPPARECLPPAPPDTRRRG